MRADRLLSLMLLLQKNKKMTAEALAQELEVSKRTIYRDIDALSVAGVPIYALGGPGGGYALLDSYRTTLTGLTDSEVRTLFMLTLPGPLLDLGVNQSLKGTILKLTQSLSSSHLEQAETVSQRLLLDSARWFQSEKPLIHLQLLQDAVWSERQLLIHYRRRQGEGSRRIINPYSLVAKAGLWYLIGEHSGRFIVYRVSRIESVELQETYFSRSEAFNLARFWEDWVLDYESSLPQYRVTMRVSPEAAEILPFVLSETVKMQLDETPSAAEGWRTIDYVFERRDEARMFMLGMGASVELLAPTDLREEIMQFATEMVQHYRR